MKEQKTLAHKLLSGENVEVMEKSEEFANQVIEELVLGKNKKGVSSVLEKNGIPKKLYPNIHSLAKEFLDEKIKYEKLKENLYLELCYRDTISSFKKDVMNNNEKPFKEMVDFYVPVIRGLTHALYRVERRKIL